jgi:hypothetical protein
MPQCALVDSSSVAAPAPERRGPYIWLLGILAVYAAGFMVYAETLAYTWDETYHLVAAWLIGLGRKPYIDFCFPQTPWNAYWVAGWMRLLGLDWHVPHAFQALFTIAAVLLTADYVYFRFPIARWRFGAALASGLATGLNAMVFAYGPLAQAYGICIFGVVAAFRFTVIAVDRKRPWWAGMAGFFAGMAAASSLLSAAAAPVLLVWMMFCNRSGEKWKKFAAWVICAAVPFTPVFWLFWLGPRQTWFNVVQYHALYRRLYWPETTQHDLEVLSSWIDSGQSLLLGAFAVFGLYYVAKRSGWPHALKLEFYLCGWLALALAALVGRAHPTFERYFLLMVPFLAVLAAAGLYGIASRLLDSDRPRWAVILFSTFMLLCLGKNLYERGFVDHWAVYRKQAQKVDEVTPRNALVLAEEPIYFFTRRIPPPGFELAYTHLLNLPPAEAALLHIVNKDEVKRQVLAGKYATAYSCDDDEIADFGLKERYKQHVDMDDCTIFWDFKK